MKNSVRTFLIFSLSLSWAQAQDTPVEATPIEDLDLSGLPEELAQRIPQMPKPPEEIPLAERLKGVKDPIARARLECEEQAPKVEPGKAPPPEYSKALNDCMNTKIPDLAEQAEALRKKEMEEDE